MNSPPNFCLMASTSGLDHGSCCGPLGFGGTAGAAGFAPGGGGGGLGAAAFGSPAGAAGFGGSAGFSGCLSLSSSATFKSGLYVRTDARHTKTWIQPHRSNECQRPLGLFLSVQQKIVAQRSTA